MDIMDVPFDCIGIIIGKLGLIDRGRFIITCSILYKKYRNLLRLWKLACNGPIKLLEDLDLGWKLSFQPIWVSVTGLSGSCLDILSLETFSIKECFSLSLTAQPWNRNYCELILTIGALSNEKIALMFIEYLLEIKYMNVMQFLSWAFVIAVNKRNYLTAKELSKKIKPERKVRIYENIKNEILDLHLSSEFILRDFLNRTDASFILINRGSRFHEIKLLFDKEQVSFMRNCFSNLFFFRYAKERLSFTS